MISKSAGERNNYRYCGESTGKQKLYSPEKKCYYKSMIGITLETNGKITGASF